MKSQGLLIIGKHDDKYVDRNARHLFEYTNNAGIETRRIDYSQLFSGEPEGFKSENLLIALFFPHSFWDSNCENPKDTLLYGTSKQSYQQFRQFFLDVEEEILIKYAQHDQQFLIDPRTAFVDRDKIRTLEILAAKQIPVTEAIQSRNIDEVLDHITAERGIFIKCRYGAEGKGITYLSAEGWFTNYKVDGGKLGNYAVREKWLFTDISGRRDILEEILDHEMIVEKEIVTPEIEAGTKFDLRACVVGKEVPHMFLRINPKDRIITNFSQGARTEHDFNRLLDPAQIIITQKVAKETANALQAEFMGVDCMFNMSQGIYVVEAQVFTDFPDINHFNLAQYLVDRIKEGRL